MRTGAVMGGGLRMAAGLAWLAAALAVSPVAAKKLPKIPPVAPSEYSVPPLTPDNTWNLMLSTGGPVVIQLRPDKAPKSVERIKTLTARGFYNGLTFHRVIEGFMAQTGDPAGTGAGGSDLPNVPAEFNDIPHVRGVVAMARAKDKDSANSQYFIMLQPNFSLDGSYSPFGRVISGINYVDAVERGEPPANPSRVIQAWVGPTDPRPPAPLPAAAPADAKAPAYPTTLPTTPPVGASPK